MSVDHEKRKWNEIMFLLVGAFAIVVILDYLLFMEFIVRDPDNAVSSALYEIFDRLRPEMMLIRGIYVLGLAGAFWLTPNFKGNRNAKPADKYYYMGTALLLAAVFVIGFLPFYYYNLVIYPVWFILLLPVISKAVSLFRKNLKDEDVLGAVSCEAENDMSFDFETDKGRMRIHSPQQGIFIEGGAGAGKSASVIEPILWQAAQKGYAGFVYDFKGKPPTLSKTVYTALQQSRSKVKFVFINFVELERTFRVNPIAPEYMETSLHASEFAEIFMTNLNRSWVERKDFWADNAISIVKGIMWMLRKNHPDQCTIPHVITLALTEDYNALFNWMLQDEEVGKLILPTYTAYKEEAKSQLAGALSSAQLPISKLYTREVFWVLSGNEVSLDITHPDAPKFLCVASDPSLQEALSPAISLIAKTCINQMNRQGKVKSIFCVDELPTIYISKLDNLPATSRSNKVVTCLAVQDFEQLDRDYGTKNANVILGNMGNQFIGMSNNIKTGERVSRMFGEYKKKDMSYSESTGGVSMSESLKNEKVVQAKDVCGQDIGHFMGKVAGGKPPFFSVQLPEFDPDKNEIPLFSLPAETGDPAKDRRVLEKLVEQNFKKINQDVKTILAPFKAGQTV